MIKSYKLIRVPNTCKRYFPVYHLSESAGVFLGQGGGGWEKKTKGKMLGNFYFYLFIYFTNLNKRTDIIRLGT